MKFCALWRNDQNLILIVNQYFEHKMNDVLNFKRFWAVTAYKDSFQRVSIAPNDIILN